MISREFPEPCNRRIRPNRAREIKGWIEQCAARRHHALGDCDAMQRRPGIDPESDGEINGVPSPEAPCSERERLLHGLGIFAGAADQENPERLDSELLDSV